MSISVKILVPYHNMAKKLFFNSDILTPIHVVRDNATEQVTTAMQQYMIGDNTGDNISKLNTHYCELTAMYWAWKNMDKLNSPYYIGFMHYRRLFNFNKNRTTRLKYLLLNCLKFIPYVNVKKYMLLMNSEDIKRNLNNTDILIWAKLGCGTSNVYDALYKDRESLEITTLT